MIRFCLILMMAYPAIAGAAVSGAATAVPMLKVGETIAIETEDGAVRTLVVRSADRPLTDTRPALLIGLHGYGMDESQIATLVNIGPDFDHVYLAPRGFHELFDRSRAWWPIATDGSAVSVASDDLHRFIDRFTELVDGALERTGADPEQVYIIGYSQGGAAAITLAASRPRLATAFVAFAGAVLDETWDLAAAAEDITATKLFIGHGSRDAFVSVPTMRADVERLRGLGVALTYREYPVPHVVSAAQRRDAKVWLETIRETR